MISLVVERSASPDPSESTGQLEYGLNGLKLHGHSPKPRRAWGQCVCDCSAILYLFRSSFEKGITEDTIFISYSI